MSGYGSPPHGNTPTVPLYCCEDCKRAFTGFRHDAVHAHNNECPVCAGTLRLAFSVEEASADQAVTATPDPDGEGLGPPSARTARRPGL